MGRGGDVTRRAAAARADASDGDGGGDAHDDATRANTLDGLRNKVTVAVAVVEVGAEVGAAAVEVGAKVGADCVRRGTAAGAASGSTG